MKLKTAAFLAALSVALIILGQDTAEIFRELTHTNGAVAPAPAAVRFKADPAMAGHTLGETTPQGIQVLKNGKVIGYYK